MGLDMYLFRRKKANNSENNEEVMYWRKANQIRQWFVNNTELQYDDNCKEIVLTKEILEKLCNDCRVVLTNRNKASMIMPTSSGFFFGGTEYDEWYFEELENTVKRIEEIINETNFDEEIIVYDEWY